MLSKLKATIDRIVESVKPVLSLVVPASCAAIIPWFFLAVGQLPLLNDWMPLAALLIVAVVVVWIVVALGPRNKYSPTVVMFLTVAFVSLTEGIFAMLYLGMSTRCPAAFSEPLSRASAAYFTISTATTTGLGDIHPVTDSARMLVTAQMIVSLVVVAAALGTAFQRSLSRDSPSPRSQ